MLPQTLPSVGHSYSRQQNSTEGCDCVSEADIPDFDTPCKGENKPGA